MIHRTDTTVDVIELAVLGVLTDADLHGYELKKRLREVLGPLSSVSFGSLYPALARLERAGAVKAVAALDLMPSVTSAGEEELGRLRRGRSNPWEEVVDRKIVRRVRV